MSPKHPLAVAVIAAACVLPVQAAGPQRLISLAPHATEYAYFVGAGSQLVGAVEYSDHPEAAKHIPRIGGYQTLSLEKIASLSPSLVLIWPSGNPANVYDALKERKIPLFETDPHTTADIARELRALATRLNMTPEHLGKVDAFEAEIASLRHTYGQRPKVSVFYEVWEKPLYTLGGKHFFNDLLSICGGRNVYADVTEPAPIVSLESLLARKPEVILSSARHGDQSLQAWRQGWQKWQQIPAVKDRQLHYVDGDIFTRPTPRAVLAAKVLCEYLERKRTLDAHGE